MTKNVLAQITQHTINTPYMVGPVHCYSGRLAGELVLFDTGPPTPEGRRYLQENIDLDKLKHVIVTHCHVDHYGQAHWLEQNCDAALYFPYRDCLKISQHEQRMQEMYLLLQDLGFDQNYLDGLEKIFDSGEVFPPVPKNILVAENDLPAHLGLKIVACPGHSQSDLVYVSDDWAITGDTLLRGVFQSPLLDIDLLTGGRFKNYQAYCTTLVKLSSLEGKKILPSHRQSIPTISKTLLFYVSKMLNRAEQLYPFRNEQNLLDLLDKVLKGRKQDIFNTYLKASEVIFMKDFLQQPELLRAALEEIGLFDQLTELYHAALRQ